MSVRTLSNVLLDTFLNLFLVHSFPLRPAQLVEDHCDGICERVTKIVEFPSQFIKLDLNNFKIGVIDVVAEKPPCRVIVARFTGKLSLRTLVHERPLASELNFSSELVHGKTEPLLAGKSVSTTQTGAQEVVMSPRADSGRQEVDDGTALSVVDCDGFSPMLSALGCLRCVRKSSGFFMAVSYMAGEARGSAKISLRAVRCLGFLLVASEMAEACRGRDRKKSRKRQAAAAGWSVVYTPVAMASGSKVNCSRVMASTNVVLCPSEVQM